MQKDEIYAKMKSSNFYLWDVFETYESLLAIMQKVKDQKSDEKYAAKMLHILM